MRNQFLNTCTKNSDAAPENHNSLDDDCTTLYVKTPVVTVLHAVGKRLATDVSEQLLIIRWRISIDDTMANMVTCQFGVYRI